MIVRKIGIDLGTANTLVFIPHKGIVINEPSVVAIAVDDNKILAIGAEAREMLGRTPEVIKTYKPLKDGVIADYQVTAAMLKYFMDKVIGPWKLFKPDLIISVPVGITSTERRAVIGAARQAGAKEAYVAREPILAALGTGVPINSAGGNMIVNIGGGTTEVAVISLGGVVLNNINELITKITGVPSYTADEPLYSVAKGTGVILDNLDLYKKSITTYR